MGFPLASVSCAILFTYCFISSDHRLLTKRLAAHYSSYPVCFSSSSWIGWTSVIRADNVSCFNASHWGDFMLYYNVYHVNSSKQMIKTSKMGESLISKLLMEGGGWVSEETRSYVYGSQIMSSIQLTKPNYQKYYCVIVNHSEQQRYLKHIGMNCKSCESFEPWKSPPLFCPIPKKVSAPYLLFRILK